MPQEEDQISPDYAKGFNQMAFIAKHDPELAKQFLSAKGMQGERVKGMLAGGKQAKEERKAQEKEKMIAEQKAIAGQAKQKKKAK